MATVALLAPSAVADLDLAQGEAIMQKLSVGLAILLIVAYGLGLLFSLKTHKELFASAEHSEGEAHWPIGLAGRDAARRHRAGRAGERDLCGVRAEGGGNIWDEPGLCRVHHRLVGGRCRRVCRGLFRGAQGPPRHERQHRAWQCFPDRAVRSTCAGAAQLCRRTVAAEPAVL